MILVTPHLVDAMDCHQVPKRLPGRETRNPDDFELYLENILEAPRGQRNVFDGKRYRAAWKNDPTAAVYPCYGSSHYGDGCGPDGACVNGACVPAPKGAAAIGPAPGELPPAVNGPADIPAPPKGR